MLSPAELERRKPVWLAFSDFWLDNELQEYDFQYISRVAAESGYTVAELREIYLYEVAPVVCHNLHRVAGEWALFDEAWLFEQAKRRAEHRSLWLRFLLFTGLGKDYLTCDTEAKLQRVFDDLSKSDCSS